MIKAFFQKKKRLPLFLVPKVRKRHALPIYKDHEAQWKLFAEGALRNQVFYDEMMYRGHKMLLIPGKKEINKARLSRRISQKMIYKLSVK
ncbi:hypothetical protein ABF87_03640 [Nitrosomonas sp. JL21]|uniref:hypothetical protein n=1 Tax=Nitrosomonas sp. JL21 TaxID=153949 RepID=UPI0013696DA6|nr:hypothetical protein [Nitrosomonas sp. JL21]MXS77064.1 hypothetical protein [Nitrosomonas sp. JL21]